MAFQVGLPSIFHRWLESQYQHALGTQLLGQLVGGKGLAKAHLGVPQKAWRGIRILGPDGLVVVQRLVHRLGLFGAHAKSLVVSTCEPLASAQFCEHGLDVFDRATDPFQFGILQPLLDQRCAHFMVREDASIIALRRLVQHDGVVLNCGGLQLFSHAQRHITRGLPHLEQAGMILIRNGVSVDARPGGWFGSEDVLDGRLIHRRLHSLRHHPTGRSTDPSGGPPFR